MVNWYNSWACFWKQSQYSVSHSILLSFLVKNESKLEAKYSFFVVILVIFLMFHNTWTRKYPLIIRIVDILCVHTKKSYCTTLSSLLPICHLPGLVSSITSEGTEHCTLKWLRLCWIQVSWLTGSCSHGVLAVHVWIGGNISPPVMHCSHNVWPQLQAQEKHDCWNCVYSSNSWSAPSGWGKKTPQTGWKHPRGWAVLCCVIWYR